MNTEKEIIAIKSHIKALSGSQAAILKLLSKYLPSLDEQDRQTLLEQSKALEERQQLLDLPLRVD